MQPAHPGDSSYAKAAELLRRRDFARRAAHRGPPHRRGAGRRLRPGAAARQHPEVRGDDRGRGRPATTTPRSRPSASFVEAGGGLVILAESEQDKYDSNLADIAAGFGITVEHATVQDYRPPPPGAELGRGGRSDRATRCSPTSSGWSSTARASLSRRRRRHRARPLEQSHAAPASAPLLARPRRTARGRVVVAADSDLFGDDCIECLRPRPAVASTSPTGRRCPRSPSQVDHPRLARSS